MRKLFLTYTTILLSLIQLDDKNRYGITNSLKPLLTNETININPKGKTPYEIKNTTNYLALTNYQDACPINDQDRRYCIVFSPYVNREGFEDEIQESSDEKQKI